MFPTPIEPNVQPASPMEEICVFVVPSPGAHQRILSRQVPRQGKQERDNAFGNRSSYGITRDSNKHIIGGAGRHINHVIPNTPARNHRQPFHTVERR